MISNPRHGSPPRLMAHQPTRCSTTQESSIRVHRPDPVLDGSQLARVIVRIAGVGTGPWLLALDRTCWTFGRYDINILMLAIIHKGIAIPVMWDVLGRAGTSTTAQRSALLSRFCAVFGETAIAGLIADREFIGTA